MRLTTGYAVLLVEIHGLSWQPVLPATCSDGACYNHTTTPASSVQIIQMVISGTRPQVPAREALPGPDLPDAQSFEAYCTLMRCVTALLVCAFRLLCKTVCCCT